MKTWQSVRTALGVMAVLITCCGMGSMDPMGPVILPQRPLDLPTSRPKRLGEVSFDTPCVQDASIADFTLAHATFVPTPAFPQEDVNEESEGWVQLGFTISRDGTVRDIVVLDAIGAKSVAASASKALATWHYSPATHHGVPVDQFGNTVNVVFRYAGSDADEHATTHAAIVRKYNTGRSMLAQKKFDDAIPTLESALDQRLNLYEQSLVSLALVVAYAAKQDKPRSLYHLRHATIQQGFFLDRKVAQAALELRVQAEAEYGDFAGARCAFDQLKSVAPAAAADGTSAAKIVARIGEALKDPAPIVVAAELSPVFGGSQAAEWRHALLRRKFSFSDIKGEMKGYHLVCQTTVLDAAIDAETLWTVPPDAGSCTLSVRGSAGASFKLVEE